MFKAFKSLFKGAITTKSEKHNAFNYVNNIYNDLIFTTSKVSAKEYVKNAIVYKCVKLIATSASHVPMVIMRYSKYDKQLIKDKNHFCNKLFRRPNPFQGGAEFFTRAFINKLIYGESYILMLQNPLNLKNLELHLIDNQSIEPILENTQIKEYVIKQKNKKVTYPIDSLSNQSRILHLVNYNPLNPLRGLSCLEPAAKAISLHNKATEWNNILLQNGASPSGALVVKDPDRYLSEEEFNRLKKQIHEKYSGHLNAGKPLILEGGLDWKEMSMTPKDMDFAESKDTAAREIALACGVPPQLLGIKGDNTYSNMQEARIALWEETIIPLLDNVSDSLSSWLSHWLEEDLIIDFDRDAISAIRSRRDTLWSKINEVNFMTINEKRELLGLSPLKDYSELKS
jgi:HK97 family phage portal protein